MAEIVVGLLRRGIVVSLVTAAGYPGQPERYEQRLKGVCYILHFQLSFFFEGRNRFWKLYKIFLNQ